MTATTSLRPTTTFHAEGHVSAAAGMQPLPSPAAVPAPAEAEFVVAPESCGAARRFVAQWCRAAGLSADATGDVILTASELAANARHGKGRTMRVGIGLVGVGEQAVAVRIEVLDDGTWQAPRSAAAAGAGELHEEGRGLAIVADLAADVAVLPEKGGTRVRADIRIR